MGFTLLAILWTGSQLLRFCILLYVAVWLCAAVRSQYYLKRHQPVNIYKAIQFRVIAKTIRWAGWVPALFLFMFLTWTLPEISLVTQDFPRRKAELEKLKEEGYYMSLDGAFHPDDAFYLDHYYSIFAYKGHSLSLGDNMLINDTDSALILYKVELSNGRFTHVRVVDAIGPGQSKDLYFSIDHPFSKPSESFGYVKPSRKNKSVEEVALCLRNDSDYHISSIETAIARRRIPLYPSSLEPDYKQYITAPEIRITDEVVEEMKKKMTRHADTPEDSL